MMSNIPIQAMGFYVALNRMSAALAVGVFFAAFMAPAIAQSGRARATADVDLSARLKEVEGNPKLLEELLKTGQKVAAVCSNCHGDGGNSSKPDVPNLAGQNPAYLLEQVRQFAEGQRRNAFMEGMIKALKSDEKIGMVLFYTRQTVTGHKSNASAVLQARGKDYFNKICWRCHAEDGHGSDKFARIAGQQAVYLEATLKRYRTGVGGRTDPLMAASTKLMTDADIDAVVAYVSSMP
jgi:cytochrome c553